MKKINGENLSCELRRFREVKNMKCVSLIGTILCLCIANGLAQSSSYNGAVFLVKLTNASNDESKTIFNVGEEILVKPSIENNSNELFPYLLSDERYLYKFSLTKVGETLPIGYRRDKAEILSLREENDSDYAGRRLTPDPTFPGEVLQLFTMKLSDRYENLTPGSYKLTIEYKTSKEIVVNNASKKLRLTREVDFDIVEIAKK